MLRPFFLLRTVSYLHTGYVTIAIANQVLQTLGRGVRRVLREIAKACKPVLDFMVDLCPA